MKNILTPLNKNLLISLGITATASETDAVIQKKIFGSGTTKLIITNKEIEDIMKIYFEESSLFINEVSETFKNETKEQKVDFSQRY